jgi:small subunit ribosomal protein MRP21
MMAIRPFPQYLGTASSSLSNTQQSTLTLRPRHFNHIRRRLTSFQSIQYLTTSPYRTSSDSQNDGEASASKPHSLTPETEVSMTSKSQSQTPPAESTSPYDQILNKLKLNSQRAAQTTKSMKESIRQDRAISLSEKAIARTKEERSVSIAVKESAETESYRVQIRRVDLKLGTALGRQIHVEPEKGVDLAAAIRNLQINCSLNRVRAQSNQQKFHIRRGQRRKDLRRERWKKLFKFSFSKTVGRIQRMRAQGW